MTLGLTASGLIRPNQTYQSSYIFAWGSVGDREAATWFSPVPGPVLVYASAAQKSSTDAAVERPHDLVPEAGGNRDSVGLGWDSVGTRLGLGWDSVGTH